MIRAANVRVYQSYHPLFIHYQETIDPVTTAWKSELNPEKPGSGNPSWESYLKVLLLCFAFYPSHLIWIYIKSNYVYLGLSFAIAENANLYLQNIMHLTRMGEGDGFRKADHRKRILYYSFL